MLSHIVGQKVLLVVLGVLVIAKTPHPLARAQTQSPRAHLTVHNSYSIALFQCGHSALAQGKMNLCSAFICTHFHLVHHVFVERSVCPFPPVLSSPTCSVSRTSATTNSFGGCGRNLCASDWSGMSGCLANPTPNTGCEPNFYSYMNEEHTPINLPESKRNFQCRDDATIISATEDPAVFRIRKHPAAASKPQQAEFPTMLGSSGASLWKQRPESVNSRASIQATGANVDRQSVVPTIFSSQPKGKSDRDQNVVRSLKERKSPENP